MSNLPIKVIRDRDLSLMPVRLFGSLNKEDSRVSLIAHSFCGQSGILPPLVVCRGMTISFESIDLGIALMLSILIARDPANSSASLKTILSVWAPHRAGCFGNCATERCRCLCADDQQGIIYIFD